MDQAFKVDWHPSTALRRRIHPRDDRFGGPVCHGTGQPIITTELGQVTCLLCRELHRARSTPRAEWVSYRVHLALRDGTARCRNPLARRIVTDISKVTCCTCKKEETP